MVTLYDAYWLDKHTQLLYSYNSHITGVKHKPRALPSELICERSILLRGLWSYIVN